MPVQRELRELTEKVLGDKYLRLTPVNHTIVEQFIPGAHTTVRCEIQGLASDGMTKVEVEGTGVGHVDALFNGLKSALLGDYTSLSNIFIVGFTMLLDLPKEKQLITSHADAPVTIELTVVNDRERRFVFSHTSRSALASMTSVVVECFEHFINAETAVLSVYGWISRAQHDRRPELVEKYTNMLAVLVKNATYCEAIERAKEAIKIG